ncbi:MAG TPA: MMPL family transporter [Myxococcales bacterium]
MPERDGLISRVTSAAVERPWRFLLGALVLTAIAVKLASGLEIRSSFAELLPEDVPSVREIKELIKRVGGDGTILVVVQSLDGPQGLKQCEALGDELAKEILALGPQQIRSVQSSMGKVRAWYENHWPLFLPLGELEKARDAVKAEIQKQKAKANPLALDEDDAQAKTDEKPPELLDLSKPSPRERVAERFEQYVDGYMVAPDKTSITILVRPAGTSLGVSESRALVDRVQALVDAHKPEMDKQHLRVGLAGTFPMFLADYEAIINDVAGTALLCVSAVLLSIFLFFRDARSMLSLGIAVLIAVAITFGITKLTIGFLNTQTAFLGAIVVGNGINYGLIYLARLKQLRLTGLGLREASVEAAHTTARATLLASAATSVSFGVLIIAANRGFRDFGIIGGIGMLLCWLSTFLLVPALLSLYERVRGAPKVKPVQEHPRLLQLTRGMLRGSKGIIAAYAVLTVVAAVLFIRQVPHAMERNLDNLSNELKGHDQLRKDEDRAQSALGRSIAGSIALLDSWEEADKFCDVIRERAKHAPYDKLIDSCNTLSSVVPRDQEAKLAVIGDIAAQLPDSVLKHLDDAHQKRVREVRDELLAQRPVTVQEADPTLVDAFRERDGTVGHIASVTAQPNAKTELAQNLEDFVKGVRNVPVDGKKFDAIGENVIFADLLQNIDREGPRTTFLSFAGVLLLVFVFFRNVRTSLEVVGSLTVGVVLMCGVAAAIDLKINFFNFIVFPITFGIAVDYGANVAARTHERANRVAEALAEVGPAVVLCSWTSFIGYATLLYSLNRALRSFGWYAMIGEITTITTAVVLLPAILQLKASKAARETS